jgi:hypothetical protein
MFIKTSLDRFANLVYIGLTRRSGNMVNILRKMMIIFIFDASKILFESFIGFEISFIIHLG